MTITITGNCVCITGNCLRITLTEAEDHFDVAFEPILVTGDDGNEYNVINSDQFK